MVVGNVIRRKVGGKATREQVTWLWDCHTDMHMSGCE